MPRMAALRVEWIRLTPEVVQIGLASQSTFCSCPACGQRSSRVHSHYNRTLQDLPAHGRVIQLQIRIRRFFCDFPDCRRKTFAERFPEVTNAHWRKTCRLTQALRQIGLAAGGESGARLAGELGMPLSPDTMLRLMRRTALLTIAEPRCWGWMTGLFTAASDTEPFCAIWSCIVPSIYCRSGRHRPWRLGCNGIQVFSSSAGTVAANMPRGHRWAHPRPGKSPTAGTCCII